jgi:membrane fusion protein (multidrug efflux system)
VIASREPRSAPSNHHGQRECDHKPPPSGAGDAGGIAGGAADKPSRPRRRAAARRRRATGPHEGRGALLLTFVGRIKAVDTVQLRARVEGFLDKIALQGRSARQDRRIALSDREDAIPGRGRSGERQSRGGRGAGTQRPAPVQSRAELVKTQAVAQTTLDQDRANLDSAKASVLQNKAALAIARRTLATPTSGRPSTDASV